MLTRNCLKVISSSRSYIIQRLLACEKYPKSITCKCIQNQACRLISTTAGLRHASQKLEGKYSALGPQTNKFVNNPNSSLTSEELLEKLMQGLSSDKHQKNRVYKNDLVRVISKIKEMNFSSKKQGLFLLQCCTELLPDETATNRLALAEQIWKTLRAHTKFGVEHYNELLRVNIANNRTLPVSTFIQQMSPVKPNITTYELFLRALGESGDLNQATEVISNMKSQGLPATEDIFNSLILCQGKAGNPQNIQEVLMMMKSLKLDQSADTITAVCRSLIWNQKDKQCIEEIKNAVNQGIQLGEKHVMEILKTSAFVGNYTLIPKVLRYLPGETLKSPSISPLMQSVATQLVFLNHPMAALEIYKCLPLPSFGPKDDAGLHGRSLVRDCVKASMPTSVIGEITDELMSSGRNSIALQSASEAALQLGKVPMALDLFARMQQKGIPVRPHYFWPILLHNARSFGEKGIMSTLQTMVSMDINPDYETVMEYVLPHVSFTSPQNLMKKLKDCGVAVSLVLTPVMETLLNMGQVRAASEIGELFQGKIDADKLLKPLLRGYLSKLDVQSTVYILEDITKKATQKDKDWVGRFLCEFIQHRKITQDVSDFVNLLKELKIKNVKISTMTADFCISRLPTNLDERTMELIKDTLIEITDERLVDEAEMFTYQIPHPKRMDEESLRAHLNELEAKNMNTRGVLRKLLQKYCSQGNLEAAKEIVKKCEKEGVFLSAGMKASIFDLHVKQGELELAELSLAELNKTSPNFTLDEHKVIDFATLMVFRGNIAKAVNLINEQSKKRRVMGGRNIEMNCWRLLDATATHGTAQDTKNMFHLMVTLGYCKPNNSMLGPLIRVHLKNDNIEEAIKEFSALVNKYNKTPLKHELLCKILILMSDGQSEENFLINERANGPLNKAVQVVLNADKKVHGAGDVTVTLIAALAEVGYKKSLRKMFLDPTVKFHPEALLRQCERFADEKKVDALLLIAESAKDRRNFDIGVIYDLVLSVLQRNDDSSAAISLWQKIQESDVTPSQKFVRNMCSILKTNNKEIPSELAVLLDDKRARC